MADPSGGIMWVALSKKRLDPLWKVGRLADALLLKKLTEVKQSVGAAPEGGPATSSLSTIVKEAVDVALQPRSPRAIKSLRGRIRLVKHLFFLTNRARDGSQRQPLLRP